MLGRKLSHYSLQEQIGAGGMGVVYRARDETLGRDVAIKLLHPKNRGETDSYQRLLAEARIASALNHPHICTVHEVGEADGQAFIVMEFVAGQPLSALIPQNGLPTELIFEYGKQAADALAHAHAHGILHRDLKSANVMVNTAGSVKLLDFGLSQRLEPKEISGVTASKSYVEESDALAGTLQYLSPEVLRGEMPDARSDIWALGVVLFEMAAGSPPFHGRSIFELTTAILQNPPATLPQRIPPGLRAVILRCLTKAPAQRYQQASEVHAALEALQSSADWESAVRPARADPRRWILPGVLAFLVLAAGTIFVVRNRHANLPGGLAPGGRLTLLVSSDKTAAEPALSPDGKMIAYIGENQGKDNLFLSRVAGGERIQLTSDARGESNPQFSPDGEHIVFTRLVPTAKTTEICTIPTLGGEAIPVIREGVYPSWSPDGTRLSFILQKPGEPEALATVAADGSDLHILFRGDADLPFFGYSSWSPDGKLIAFVRSPGGVPRQIWLIPSSGGTPRRLSNDPSGVFSDDPAFTADGRGVVHRSNRAGATNLWVWPLEGSAPVRLTSGTGPDDSPSVAKDGRIAFLNSRSKNVLIVENLGSGETRQIYTHAFALWAPAFSPDGKQVAVSQLESDGSWHIWLISTESGNGRQLTFGKVPEVYPRFSPDGKYVVYFTYGNQPSRIWRVPVSGGPATTLTPERGGSDAYGDVSPDGKWMVFSRVEKGTVRVYVMPFDGGEARRLTNGAATVPRWSPDGQWIAFSPARDWTAGVWVMRSDGTAARRVSETGGWPVWWPEDNKIGFQIVGADGNTHLEAVPFSGGPAQAVRGPEFNGTNYPFDVSRDGKFLVTTNDVHVSDEIWLLEPSALK
jgi:eukaryotic-like serine/threonine-protein kinase